MYEVALAEAEGKLGELVEQARRGEEVILTENNIAVARLLPMALPEESRAGFGGARDVIIWMADDFDAPMPELEEYF